MSLIADGLLIATCLTTALYCMVLSRRLRRLSDTGDGVGQQILRLNTALAETRAAVEEMRSSARSASDRLQDDMAAAKRQSQQLQSQIARALKSGVADCKGATRTASNPSDTPSRSNPTSGRQEGGPEEGDWAVSLQPAVEFESLDPLDDDELDEDLRLADAPVSRDAGIAPAADGPVDENSDYVGPGDVSEDENHWPFDDTDSEMAGSQEANGPAAGDDGDDLAAADRPRGGPISGRARTLAAEGGDHGLLRVERMAV